MSYFDYPLKNKTARDYAAGYADGINWVANERVGNVSIKRSLKRLAKAMFKEIHQANKNAS